MRKSKYADIGRNAKADEFLRVLKKTAGSRFFHSFADNKLKALTDGAVEAFYDGRPENIQTALQNLKPHEFGSGPGKAYYPHFVVDMFYKLLEKSVDNQADIELALAKAPEPDKKEILNQVLYGATVYGGIENYCRRFSEESFIASLLKAGADVNAVINGNEGIILANAAYSFSLPVIKLLDENGARFDKAISFMQANGWGDKEINKLKSYLAIKADKPQPAAVEADAWRQEMAQQIADLTQEVKRLKSSASKPAAPTLKIKTPQNNHPEA